MPPSAGTPSDINVTYIPLKSILMGISFAGNMAVGV